MTHRATFTLDEDAFGFLKKMGGTNRSAFINDLIKREKRRTLEKSILQANKEEAADRISQEELHDWDETLEDGLEP